MKGKRTGVDFSKHEVIITQAEGLLVHYIKKPGTICDSIRFINTHGILAVNGDYGNWLFCREFHPSQEGGVCDGYWKEKLRIASTQEPSEFDNEETESRLKKELNGGLEEHGYTGKKLEEMKEYIQECLNVLPDGELPYISYAYQNYPSFCDHESVIHVKKTKYWLLAVFDGFDEICRRIKAGELPEQKKATA